MCMLAGWSKASDLERPGLATSQMPSLEAVQEMERMLAAVVDDSPPGGVSESPSVCGHDGYLAG